MQVLLHLEHRHARLLVGEIHGRILREQHKAHVQKDDHDPRNGGYDRSRNNQLDENSRGR
jgi:hypothetical protein